MQFYIKEKNQASLHKIASLKWCRGLIVGPTVCCMGLCPLLGSPMANWLDWQGQENKKLKVFGGWQTTQNARIEKTSVSSWSKPWLNQGLVGVSSFFPEVPDSLNLSKEVQIKPLTISRRKRTKFYSWQHYGFVQNVSYIIMITRSIFLRDRSGVICKRSLL